jgi:Secretion system C-terminal sorting domain
MKKIYILTILLFVQNTHYGQRFLPVLLENAGSMKQYEYTNGAIYDLQVYNSQLLAAGKFTQFMGTSAQNLAVWDGEASTEFSPAPTFINASDRIHQILTYNNTLIISGKLPNYNGAAILQDNVWVNFGIPNQNEIKKIQIADDRIFAGFGNSLFERINDEWLNITPKFAVEINDYIAFENKLFIAVDNKIYRLDENIWYEFPEVLDSYLSAFSIVENELFATGNFASDDFGNTYKRVLKISGNNFDMPTINLPLTDLLFYGKLFKVHGVHFLCNAGSLFGGGPDKCVKENDSYSGVLQYAPVDIEYFQGRYYTIINGQTNLMNKGMGYIETGTSECFLDNQTIAPYIEPTARHFRLSDQKAGFIFNDNSEVPRSVIYSSSPWIYGVEEDQTFVTESTYNGLYAWMSGPISDKVDNSYLQRYHQVFVVDRSEILDHINNYLNPDYTIPQSILTWPAHGDVSKGEAPNLAPFHDVNGNGHYEPESGDYPEIRGDHCAYYILNDKFNYLNNYDDQDYALDSLQIEMHVMMYNFESENIAQNHGLYANYRIINRSNRNYDRFRCAIWSDWDIGNGTDDYVGCDSLNNYFYGYNGDSEDQAVASSPGYGQFPAAAGCVFLNQSLRNSLYYNIGTNPINGDPTTSAHYYGFMNSQWKNGQHVLWGGNGVSGFGVEIDQQANYMFPSYPWETENQVWNEITAGNATGDRRGLGSGEEFPLNSGEEFCLDIAYVAARDNSGSIDPQLLSLALLRQYILETKNIYDNQSPTCLTSNPVFTNEISDKTENWFNIYPNPGEQLNIVLPKDGKSYTIKVHDAMGLLTAEMTVGANNSFLSVNTSAWANGLYLISLVSKEKTLVRKWAKVAGK